MEEQQEDPLDFQAVVDSLASQNERLSRELAVAHGRLAYKDKLIQQLTDKLEDQGNDAKKLKVAEK